MKLTCDREMLADKLKKSIKFIPSKSLISAQENFRCTITSNVMEIVAADGEAQIKMFCPVKSDGDFSFCLEANLFLKTISLFRENEVKITKKSDNVIELKNGKASTYKITVSCFPEDFPMMPAPEVKHEVSMSQYYLKMGLKLTEKFIDDSIATNASGININNIDNRLVFTGLISSMLCRVNIPPLSIGSWDKNIVLPSETAVKIMSMLDDKAEIAMCHNGEKVIFFADDTIEKFEITSTLMNVKYPNSEALFSKRGEDYAIINVLEMKDVFMRLRLYSSTQDSDKTIKMVTHPDNVNELTFTASDVLKPKEGMETITINNISGKPINKGFHSGSMLKILANIDSNEMKFFFQENNTIACFIEPVVGENEEKNFNFIISSCQ